MYFAASQGRCEVIDALLRGGADVNKAKHDGATPLFIASETGHCDVIDALLRGGADVNKAKHDGATPLFIASETGHCDVIDALLRGGADVVPACLLLRSKSWRVCFSATNVLLVTLLPLATLLLTLEEEYCRGAFFPPSSSISFSIRAFLPLSLTSYPCPTLTM